MKGYVLPYKISPFYNPKERIPRKLKKKVKSFCGDMWSELNNGQRLWYYLESYNKEYKMFIIRKIVQNELLYFKKINSYET